VTDPLATLTVRLRAAGCVFAEQEAAELVAAATDPAHREELVRRREAGEPLEQVVGRVVFGKLRLSVGTGVFVPRQRSLLLARAATTAARRQREPVMLEAFAGVAPVASAVRAAVASIEVHASDVDDVALRHAATNLGDDVALHRGDVLTALPRSLRGRVTLLVAVPPYVPVPAGDQLTREAREYEPARALFGGPDGLAHVRSLLDQAAPWLAPDGRVLVELHRDQWPAAAAHAAHTGLRAARRDGSDGQTTLLCLQAAQRRAFRPAGHVGPRAEGPRVPPMTRSPDGDTPMTRSLDGDKLRRIPQPSIGSRNSLHLGEFQRSTQQEWF